MNFILGGKICDLLVSNGKCQANGLCCILSIYFGKNDKL